MLVTDWVSEMRFSGIYTRMNQLNIGLHSYKKDR